MDVVVPDGVVVPGVEVPVVLVRDRDVPEGLVLPVQPAVALHGDGVARHRVDEVVRDVVVSALIEVDARGVPREDAASVDVVAADRVEVVVADLLVGRVDHPLAAVLAHEQHAVGAAVGDRVAADRVAAREVAEVHGGVSGVVQLAILHRDVGGVLDLDEALPVFFASPRSSAPRGRRAPPCLPRPRPGSRTRSLPSGPRSAGRPRASRPGGSRGGPSPRRGGTRPGSRAPPAPPG